MLVDDFVSAINEWKAKKFFPGSIICVDESMIRWYGIGGDYLPIGLPHYVKINSKPDAGIEVQTSACSKSGVLGQLRLIKSKAEMAHVNYCSGVPADENAGTTAVKVLTQPWHGSNRIAVGDSAFGSVATAMATKNVGLCFVGVVKTATKKFPKDYLTNVQLGGKGDFYGMTTKHEGVDLMAFTWCDRERRTFITTAGSLAKANQQERFRYRPVGPANEVAERVLLAIDLPLSAEMYYAGNGAVDFHNRVRSKEVRMEKRLVTKRWDIRTNLGLLAMLFTDTWLLYKAARGDALHLTSNEFFEKLAEELIDADFAERNKTRAEASKKLPPIVQKSNDELHRPTKRHRHGKPNQRKQNNCIICKSSCTYICAVCSHQQVRETFVCGTKTDRKCWDEHVTQHHK